MVEGPYEDLNFDAYSCSASDIFCKLLNHANLYHVTNEIDVKGISK